MTPEMLKVGSLNGVEKLSFVSVAFPAATQLVIPSSVEQFWIQRPRDASDVDITGGAGIYSATFTGCTLAIDEIDITNLKCGDSLRVLTIVNCKLDEHTVESLHHLGNIERLQFGRNLSAAYLFRSWKLTSLVNVDLAGVTLDDDVVDFLLRQKSLASITIDVNDKSRLDEIKALISSASSSILIRCSENMIDVYSHLESEEIPLVRVVVGE